MNNSRLGIYSLIALILAACNSSGVSQSPAVSAPAATTVDRSGDAVFSSFKWSGNTGGMKPGDVVFGNFRWISEHVSVPPGYSGESAACPKGTHVISGGYLLPPSTKINAPIAAYGSSPAGVHDTAWQLFLYNPASQSQEIKISVLCFK